MKVYTYSEARQELAKLLEEARLDGEVGIKKRDGRMFILKPYSTKKSPLDVDGVDAKISLDDAKTAIIDSRYRDTDLI